MEGRISSQPNPNASCVVALSLGTWHADQLVRAVEDLRRCPTEDLRTQDLAGMDRAAARSPRRVYVLGAVRKGSEHARGQRIEFPPGAPRRRPSRRCTAGGALRCRRRGRKLLVAASEVDVVIHWQREIHTALRVSKRRRGHSRMHTSPGIAPGHRGPGRLDSVGFARSAATARIPAVINWDRTQALG
jgi:hypothetical protein